MTNTTKPDVVLSIDNLSLLSMYGRWLGLGPLASGLAAATGLGLIGVACWTFAARGGLPFPEGLEASLLLAMVPVLSPQGWSYVALIAAPAVAYLVNYQDRLSRPMRVLVTTALLVAGLTLYDLLGRRIYYALMQRSIVTLSLLVIVAGLATLRRLRVA